VSAPDASRLRWYVRRLAKMSPSEVLWRAHDKALQAAWVVRQVHRDQQDGNAEAARGRKFTATIPAGTAAQVPDAARIAVLAAADRVLRGEWEVFGVVRTDMRAPDWFLDPVSGRRAPDSRYAFRINHRSEDETGNVKQVWELSRLQHLTLLATAWFLSRNEAYARLVASQLRSWWRENPFLSGVHWTSGIEVGIRLISMAWIRRLLNDWPGAADLFENNERAVRQIRWHQRYLATFTSRGSSANNHVIAEAAGQLVACSAFPWFRQSERWWRRSSRLLERELQRNTFPSGINRELATDYQCFVAELGILAAVESSAAGNPLNATVWERLCAMVDSGAALLDEKLRPPRQGDGDEGKALLLDPPEPNRWPSLLAVGAALFGRLDWWPPSRPDAASSIIGGLFGPPRPAAGRPVWRPWRFPDAGLTVLRTNAGRFPEIWCRCDGGPHGFLSIAAHAHADALSVEVRYGGVDVLADPGTYCYHGEPEWRSYFRSTTAHNTVEVDGRCQSSEGGPFLWRRHANATEVDVQDIGDAVEWMAEHEGYMSLEPPARHRRCVRLDRASHIVDIVDVITGGCHDARILFHLGPDVDAELYGSSAMLRWPTESAPGAARLELPQQLTWTLHRGETDPILGWYSDGLGRRTPAFTIVGRGRSAPDEPFSTRLEFLDVSASGHSLLYLAESLCAADFAAHESLGDQAEAG
jgi:Heparinase II/III-like protein/Heparinase II/III N-terminus